MLKGGIFLDLENLNANGGYGIRFRAVKELVEAQGAVVLRANAYMATNSKRERADRIYGQKKEEFRNRVRSDGFHLILKELKEYRDADGEITVKANADLELAVDCLLQSDNLDYILLASGDGDFLRLVRALQNRGKRVDLLSFSNTSRELREEVDFHFLGYLVPGILLQPKDAQDRKRGYMHAVFEDGYGFITLRTGLKLDETRSDIFLHRNDYTNGSGGPMSSEEFLKLKGTMIEFDLGQSADGRPKAINACKFEPQLWD